MRELRQVLIGGAVGALVVLAASAPAAATGDPIDTTPPTDAPAETTEPPTATTPDDTLVGAGEPDTDIDGTVAAIAIVGFVALLGLASWWMVRRSNPDADPMPPLPPTGPPPSDLI